MCQSHNGIFLVLLFTFLFIFKGWCCVFSGDEKFSFLRTQKKKENNLFVPIYQLSVRVPLTFALSYSIIIEIGGGGRTDDGKYMYIRGSRRKTSQIHLYIHFMCIYEIKRHREYLKMWSLLKQIKKMLRSHIVVVNINIKQKKYRLRLNKCKIKKTINHLTIHEDKR